MISRTAEYALRAVVLLAQHEGKFLARQEIASRTGVSNEYLVKVLARLARAKFVCIKRGANGGYSLATPAKSLSLWQIIFCIDPIKPLESCPLGLKEHAAELCPLHARLRRVVGETIAAFSSVTVAELVTSAGRRDQVCHFPLEREPIRKD